MGSNEVSEAILVGRSSIEANGSLSKVVVDRMVDTVAGRIVFVVRESFGQLVSGVGVQVF